MKTLDTRITEPYKPRVELVSSNFELSHLHKTRKVFALLPHGYHESDKRYQVLYLQDAQNLFGEDTPFGSWEIDTHLATLFAEGLDDLMVIAIDHGGKERINEYSPYFHRKFGKGLGKFYAESIIKSLKPYIDKHYRTKPEREFNGIGGSSMGGLISAYIGIVYPEYFSKLMIFSPSFWFSDEIYFDAFKYNYTLPMKMYIYGGDKESEYMTKHIHRFKEAVSKGYFDKSLTQFKVSINPAGEHSEYFWSKAFPKAAKWLYTESEK